MRSLKTNVIIFFLLILFINCKDNKKDIPLKRIDSIDNVESTKEKLSKDDSLALDISENCNKTFEEFFENFAKDSLFQKNRVKYPIKLINGYYDFDKRKDTTSIELILNKNKFNYIDFTKDKNAMDKEYDKYSVSIENLDSITNYKLNGYDNGIRVNFKFKLINGCWFLVEILDEST